MNEFQKIVNEYNELHNQYSYLSFSNPIPADWANTLTVEKVAEMRKEIEWLSDIAGQFADKLGELESALQPYAYTENTVYTIGQYILQGFTSEEAPKARKYDILWNKWVNGKATPNDIAEMDAIAEALGL